VGEIVVALREVCCPAAPAVISREAFSRGKVLAELAYAETTQIKTNLERNINPSFSIRLPQERAASRGGDFHAPAAPVATKSS
jgi:hypothetical protein